MIFLQAVSAFSTPWLPRHWIKNWPTSNKSFELWLRYKLAESVTNYCIIGGSLRRRFLTPDGNDNWYNSPCYIILLQGEDLFAKWVHLLFFWFPSTKLSTEVAVAQSCRRLQRNGGWWNTVLNTYRESRFKRTFRASRATFWLFLLWFNRMYIRWSSTDDVEYLPQKLAISETLISSTSF